MPNYNDIASKGRYGDTTLMHVSPLEVEGLGALMGRPMPSNPETGYPEAFIGLPMLALAALAGGTIGAVTGKKKNIVRNMFLGATLGGLGAAGVGAAGVGAAGTAGTLAPGAGVLAPGSGGLMTAGQVASTGAPATVAGTQAAATSMLGPVASAPSAIGYTLPANPLMGSLASGGGAASTTGGGGAASTAGAGEGGILNWAKNNPGYALGGLGLASSMIPQDEDDWWDEDNEFEYEGGGGDSYRYPYYG